MTDEVTATMLVEIRHAARECSERGLMAASKWATDILLSVSASKKRALQHSIDTAASTSATGFSTSTPARSRSPPTFTDTSPVATQPLTQPIGSATTSEQPLILTRHPDAAKPFTLTEEEKRFERDRIRSEQDLLIGAKAYFDAREFKRVMYMLQGCQSAKAIFLSSYSFFLSIAGYPWNWSAWILLGSCLNDAEELTALMSLMPLSPTHPLIQIFLTKTLNELQSAAENELAICDRLLSEEYFPHSMWLMSLRASVLYHLHEYEQAEHQFDTILRIDPYRIDDIDIFSNILYVQDNKLKLSRLAHDYLTLDKDRPEVCCLVGNHYSLRQEHEKAVKYFRRATELDRTYLTAWTLMGHEYVEMKNSHAAIEAYRRAVDINRKDYRAWYGLGQAYELLSMHNYALYYYQHATALRSYDVRLWQAQGSCYEELGRSPREAIECYKRALISSELHETGICMKLARLHSLLDEKSEAAAYHRRIVEFCQEKNRPLHEYAKSCLEVADYYTSSPDGDVLFAKELLEQVAASNSEEAPRAVDMLKLAKARLQERRRSITSSWNAESSQNGSNWAGYALANGTSYNGQVLATTPAASTSTSTSTWQPPAHWKVDPIVQPTPGLPQYVKKPPKVKNRTPEELEIISQTAARFASRLAQDQAAVLNPDVDTPFQDQLDVVNRLLPYHIFQQPKEDLDSVIYGKGKGKAVDYDLGTEIAETKFALECHKRLEKIRTRWRNIKIREGQRASPDTQAYVLAQAVLEADRGETSLLSTELRTARAELERIQREQRASANAARVSQFSATPTTPTTTTPTQTQYYRAYPYTYAQPYGNPSANATTLTFPATPVATTPTYSAYQPSGAIPVQLPVASLPALHALGIVPVPATSLPPEGQPQPPAILRGSSANGTMLTLEINVSLLQSAQMHGLAVILNSLVARNAALANANSTTAAVSTTPTTTSVPGAEKKPAEAS
ncbi:hypothetical protein EST38_g267 [Candolleomyces aberdarensis]|uniref:Uncharacterized protein n=1 Tax=Candolleomyces aberdarensis TaxID=2316362 RepID=A0A4Q2E1K4_9AGAR|nr:hypothetical protein EST38_g267 [Candolleomyces aberdarensis]